MACERQRSKVWMNHYLSRLENERAGVAVGGENESDFEVTVTRRKRRYHFSVLCYFVFGFQFPSVGDVYELRPHSVVRRSTFYSESRLLDGGLFGLVFLAQEIPCTSVGFLTDKMARKSFCFSSSICLFGFCWIRDRRGCQRRWAGSD